MKTRFDNMKSILLDMYFMGLDVRAYNVSNIVSDMNSLGFENWDDVPQKVQAVLFHDNYRLDD